MDKDGQAGDEERQQHSSASPVHDGFSGRLYTHLAIAVVLAGLGVLLFRLPKTVSFERLPEGEPLRPRNLDSMLMPPVSSTTAAKETGMLQRFLDKIKGLLPVLTAVFTFLAYLATIVFTVTTAFSIVSTLCLKVLGFSLSACLMRVLVPNMPLLEDQAVASATLPSNLVGAYAVYFSIQVSRLSLGHAIQQNRPILAFIPLNANPFVLVVLFWKLATVGKRDRSLVHSLFGELLRELLTFVMIWIYLGVDIGSAARGVFGVFAGGGVPSVLCATWLLSSLLHVVDVRNKRVENAVRFGLNAVFFPLAAHLLHVQPLQPFQRALLFYLCTQWTASWISGCGAEFTGNLKSRHRQRIGFVSFLAWACSCLVWWGGWPWSFIGASALFITAQLHELLAVLYPSGIQWSASTLSYVFPYL